MAKEKDNTNKTFLLRVDAETMEAVERWAADEFRSVNGQLQWIIAEALKIESGSLYDEEFDSPADSTVSVLGTVPDEPMVDTESADFDELEKHVFSNRSWWTKEYKQARRYLYGNKKVKPDFKKARELLLLETEKGNGFAIHDLDDSISTLLIYLIRQFLMQSLR